MNNYYLSISVNYVEYMFYFNLDNNKGRYIYLFVVIMAIETCSLQFGWIVLPVGSFTVQSYSRCPQPPQVVESAAWRQGGGWQSCSWGGGGGGGREEVRCGGWDGWGGEGIAEGVQGDWWTEGEIWSPLLELALLELEKNAPCGHYNFG